jgi:orotate phosphoribosyltransferase
MEKIDLLMLKPRDYDQITLIEEDILPWFENEDAYWVYEGKPSPEKAHAELTSGLCSDGFFDCLLVLRYPNIAEILARQLALRLQTEKIGKVDWVVSSSYAAITFGHEVAKALGAIFMLVEKDPTDPNGKKMAWRRMTIPAGARVLQVEELITTSGTFQEVRRAVEESNAIKPVNFISTVGALVHRPAKLPIEYDGRRVVAVIEKAIRNFDPKDCPYCAVGSPRYRPKMHWKELTGKG